MMVLDSGVPISLVSSTWLKNYLRAMDVDNEKVERSGDKRRFELGKTTYTSVEKVKFSVRMKTDGGSQIKKITNCPYLQENLITKRQYLRKC